MRPIKLKIKGLNSFIDSQDINFEKLTNKGLFGIFGPTGSGKSTILDGITLALYGEVARKSSNYMNTNCSSLNISYEFQISSGKVKRYRVDREFRRDAKTGSVRSRSARIIDIEDNEEVILEEGAKSVTAKCEDIIGLTLEDFTRTVVLPQGKFSEFLKLEGRDRRNMLERLFNLQKYGDNLSLKLNGEVKRQKEKLNILEGELKGYENVSNEILKEKENTFEDVKKQYDKCQNKLKIYERKYNEGKELWTFQEELKEQLHSQDKLKEREDEIKNDEIKIAFGESALKLKPYIDSYEDSISQISSINDNILILSNRLNAVQEDREKIEKVLESARIKKEKELPDLTIKQQKIIDAIEEKKLLDILNAEKFQLEENIGKIERKGKSINEKIEHIKIVVDNLNSSIREKETKIEALQISEDYKRKVDEGILILNNLENLSKRKYNLTLEKTNVMEVLAKVKTSSENLLKKLKENENLLVSYNEEFNKLIKNCPGDENLLLNLQSQLNTVSDKWNKYNEHNIKLNGSTKNVEIFKIALDKKETERILLEEEIKNIKISIKRAEIENIAHNLRKTLSEGEACPVCGSRYHSIDNIKILETNNIDDLNLNLEHKENICKLLIQEIIKLETNIKSEEKNIGESCFKINELGNEFKSISVDELKSKFNVLKTDISKYNADKSDMDKNIKNLIEEKNLLQVEYSRESTKETENSHRLESIKNELISLDCELGTNKVQLESLKTDIKIEEFKAEKEEILNKEKQKNSLEKNIKDLRKKLDSDMTVKENLSKEIAELREEFKEKRSTLIEKNKNIQEKENHIKDKLGNVQDLELFNLRIQEAITGIKKEFDKAEKDKNEIELCYNQYNNDMISAKTRLSGFQDRAAKDKKKLEAELAEEGFDNIDKAKDSFITKEEINKLKLKVEEFKNTLTKLIGNIDNIKKKINNRVLLEEQWIEIQDTKNNGEMKLKILEENKIMLKTEIDSLSESISKKKKLLKSKEEMNHKLALLDDLDKLFKGKKFVEFVAANQLKYVSVEACKWLKEITAGNYGLEVDDNGKFIIRDYKNGGAQRDASTLSGGETFVASLALALALSSQIQLKGTAPLELFFLDEGFGTLDDNLLEVVMEALERIHNDKLSIGIISHVEAIKNRVPIKLIVTPAEAGMGGSKVRIERN